MIREDSLQLVRPYIYTDRQQLVAVYALHVPSVNNRAHYKYSCYSELPIYGRFCHVNNVLRHLFGVEGEGFCLPVLQHLSLKQIQHNSGVENVYGCKYASVVRGYLISRVKYWEEEKESFSLEGERVKGVLKNLIFKFSFCHTFLLVTQIQNAMRF